MLGYNYRIKIDIKITDKSGHRPSAPTAVYFYDTTQQIAGGDLLPLLAWENSTGSYGGSTTLDFDLAASSEYHVEGYLRDISVGSCFAGFCTWEAEYEPLECEVSVSLRQIKSQSVAAGGSLLPGQLGAEYLEGGGIALKVGPEVKVPSATSTQWDTIPYVGQVLPQQLFGDTFPTRGVPGQLFYIKGSSAPGVDHVLPASMYGDTLPEAGVQGQLFFLI